MNCAIQWIEISAVERIIQPLNNWGLKTLKLFSWTERILYYKEMSSKFL